MKKYIKGTAIILLTFVLITAALAFIYRKSIIKEVIPEVVQKGVIHIDIKNDTSCISTVLVIKNKTFINITIDTIKYKVSLFNKTYLDKREFLGIVLPSHKSDSIKFSLKIPYSQLLKDMQKERRSDDSAGYSINVWLQYSAGFWKSEMPINKTGRLKIPQPPELMIEDINWTRVRMKSLIADIKIKIINHGPIALGINGLNYSMNVSGQGNLKGKYNERINIKPNGITYISVPIMINTKQIGKTIFQVLSNKDKYPYSLKMKASMESSGTDKLSFDLDLNKTGVIELRK